jgi:hypothetical protein
VLDAKYKRRIELEDIEMATYVIEFSKPIKNKLYGAIATLQNTKVGKEKGSREVRSRPLLIGVHLLPTRRLLS